MHLGDDHHAAREVSRARDAWQQALVILDDLNDPRAGEIRSRLQGEVGKPAAAAAAT